MNQAQRVSRERAGDPAPQKGTATPGPAVVPHNVNTVLDDAKAEMSSGITLLVWRIDQIAIALGVDRRTVERLRSAGKFPGPDLKIGRVPLWRPATVEAWIAAGGRVNT